MRETRADSYATLIARVALLVPKVTGGRYASATFPRLHKAAGSPDHVPGMKDSRVRTLTSDRIIKARGCTLIEAGLLAVAWRVPLEAILAAQLHSAVVHLGRTQRQLARAAAAGQPIELGRAPWSGARRQRSINASV